MLPKSHRLSKAQDIKRIYQGGRQVRTANLRLFYLFSRHNASRFSFVVSKKHVRKIVDRNRLKRILRAYIGKVITSLPRNVEGVFQGQGNMPRLTTPEIQQETKELLLRAKLL